MKVCLVFENKTIPPNVNLIDHNPKIRWDEHRLEVALEPIPDPPIGYRTLVGVHGQLWGRWVQWSHRLGIASFARP